MVRFYYKLVWSACIAGLIICCLFSCLALVTYADQVVDVQDVQDVQDIKDVHDVQDVQDVSQEAVSNNEDTNNADTEPDTIHDRSESDQNNNYQDTSEIILTNISTSIQSISAEDTSGFKAMILRLIGPYEMLTKEYTYTNPSSNYQSKQVTTEPDYAWMISAGIFIIILYCFLRMIGGAIRGSYN